MGAIRDPLLLSKQRHTFVYIIKPFFNSYRVAIVVLFIIALYNSNYMCKGLIGPIKICLDGPIFQ